MELGHRLRRLRADLLEGVLVVEEAVDDRGHRHAEGRLAVVGRPGGLGDGGEVVEPLEVVEAVELVLVVELQRCVERPARDEVAGSAAVQARVERGIVIGRRRGREFDLDVGIALVEGGNDRVVPDVRVVVAPAFDLEIAGVSRRNPARQGEQSDAAAHPCDTCFHAFLLIRRAHARARVDPCAPANRPPPVERAPCAWRRPKASAWGARWLNGALLSREWRFAAKAFSVHRSAAVNKLPFLGIPVAAVLVFHYGGKGIPLVYWSRAESETAMEGRPPGRRILS